MAVNPNLVAGAGGFNSFFGKHGGQLLTGLFGGLFGGGGGMPAELKAILNAMKHNNDLAVGVFETTDVDALVREAISTFGAAADKTAEFAVEEALGRSDRQTNVGGRDSRTDLALGAASVPAGLAKADFSANAILQIPALKKMLLPSNANLAPAVGAAGGVDQFNIGRRAGFDQTLLDIGRLLDEEGVFQ